MNEFSGDSKDVYYMTIQHKEVTLFKQQLEFNQSDIVKMSIPAKEFSLVNGGVLSLNLFRIIDDIILYSAKPTEDFALPDIATW